MLQFCQMHCFTWFELPSLEGQTFEFKSRQHLCVVVSTYSLNFYCKQILMISTILQETWEFFRVSHLKLSWLQLHGIVVWLTEVIFGYPLDQLYATASSSHKMTNIFVVKFKAPQDQGEASQCFNTWLQPPSN